MIRMLQATFRLSILQRYILRGFIQTLLLCLAGATTIFVIFDFFERIGIFLGENARVWQVVSYLLFKIPLIIQLMAPVAVLIATLLTVGRLSQQSEVTAMRACGVSLFWLAKPL